MNSLYCLGGRDSLEEGQDVIRYHGISLNTDPNLHTYLLAVLISLG